MNKNRLASCILIFSIILTFVPGHATGSETGSSYQEELDFLKAAGILPEEYFEASYYVTRAEFSKIILTMIYNIADFGGPVGSTFSDVDETDEYYPYISACKKLGIVKGDNKNNFYPDDDIKGLEAIVMIINALGYTAYAEAVGVFPSGYYSIARQTGITKGVSFLEAEAATGDQIAKLVYNALFADLVAYESLSAGEMNIKIEKGKTLLSERFKIWQYDGVVIDNGITSIRGESMNDREKVSISENKTQKRITAYANGTDLGIHLGNRVKVYIHEDEETGVNKVVSYKLHPLSTEKTVNAEDISCFSDSYLEYEESNGKIQRLSFGENLPVIIFNGVHIVSYHENIIRPKDGILKLIDNNNDGIYDIVNIISLNYYLDKTDSGLPRNIPVLDIDYSVPYVNFASDSNHKLNLSSNECDYMIISRDSIKTLDDIGEYSIISVAEAPKLIDDKKFYFLIVSEDFVRGKIQSVSDTEVIVDGKGYPISKSYLAENPNFKNDLEFDQENELRLDITGKVAYIVRSKSFIRNYSFVMDVGKTSEFEPKGMVRLLSTEGKITDYTLADKLIFNNESVYSSLDDTLQRLTEYQGLLLFELNKKNEISKFILAEEPGSSPVEDEKRFVLSHETDPSVSFRGGYKAIDGIGITNTYLFEVCKDKNTGEIIEGISSVKKGAFDINAYYYGIKFYDAGKSRIAKAALILTEIDPKSFAPNSFVKRLKNFCIFYRTAEAVKADGTPGKKIYFYNKGILESRFVSEYAYDAKVGGMACNILECGVGDIFAYETDASGEIRVYSVFYYDSFDKGKQGILYLGQGGIGGKNRDNQVFKGTLVYRNANTLTLRMEDKENAASYFPFALAANIAYLAVDQHRRSVRTIALNDLEASYDSTVSVVICAEYDVVKSVIVYE